MVSEAKIPRLSTPAHTRNSRPEKHREEDTAAESDEVVPLLGEPSVAMMEQQFSGYYSVSGVCHIHVRSMHGVYESRIHAYIRAQLVSVSSNSSYSYVCGMRVY